MVYRGLPPAGRGLGLRSAVRQRAAAYWTDAWSLLVARFPVLAQRFLAELEPAPAPSTLAGGISVDALAQSYLSLPTVCVGFPARPLRLPPEVNFERQRIS